MRKHGLVCLAVLIRGVECEVGRIGDNVADTYVCRLYGLIRFVVSTVVFILENVHECVLFPDDSFPAASEFNLEWRIGHDASVVRLATQMLVPPGN